MSLNYTCELLYKFPDNFLIKTNGHHKKRFHVKATFNPTRWAWCCRMVSSGYNGSWVCNNKSKDACLKHIHDITNQQHIIYVLFHVQNTVCNVSWHNTLTNIIFHHQQYIQQYGTKFTLKKSSTLVWMSLSLLFVSLSLVTISLYPNLTLTTRKT